MIIAGIDPGKKGAICVLDEFDKPKLYLCPTRKLGKKTEYDLEMMAGLIRAYVKPKESMVFIEKAHAMPIKFKIKDEGGKIIERRQGATSLFSYGGGYYAWIMACICHDLPYQLVAPQTWKAVMLRDMPKGKNSSIIKAKQLHPGINLIPENGRKENEGLAEAYLIARYGAMQNI